MRDKKDRIIKPACFYDIIPQPSTDYTIIMDKVNSKCSCCHGIYHSIVWQMPILKHNK